MNTRFKILLLNVTKITQPARNTQSQQFAFLQTPLAMNQTRILCRHTLPLMKLVAATKYGVPS